jgi:hypothetical protein
MILNYDNTGKYEAKISSHASKCYKLRVLSKTAPLT